ncbi:prenyltransferase [Immundisolibacter sp.]|uniref:prenyltransferase n=1 Tax=Immundisolibacter sp. TaxID=1934948 RepID=UPI00262690E2|nr:prenyltransferase [Immundisolibacter sp.]
MPAWRLWLAAVRAQFLTTTVLAVLLGLAASCADGVAIDAPRAVLTLLGALLAHAGANLVNDYHDRAADAVNTDPLRPFSGGSRLIQEGRLEARQAAVAGYGLLAGAGLIGAALALTGRSQLWVIGALGLALAIAYSAPPLRLSARALGEPAIAAAWLLVVLGTDLVQRGDWSLTALLAGMPYTLLLANILLANGFPDRGADAAAGKRTLVVRLGPHGAGQVYLAIAAAAGLWLVMAVLAHRLPATTLACLLVTPLPVFAARRLRRHAPGTPNAGLLAPIHATIATAHLFGLLLTATLWWAG